MKKFLDAEIYSLHLMQQITKYELINFNINFNT